MHMALPPRKTSHPPPNIHISSRTTFSWHRQRTRYLSYSVLCLLSVYLFYNWISAGPETPSDGEIPEDSSVLLVTVLDEENISEDYITMIKSNRDDYAARHGYKTFYTNTTNYKDLYQSSPSTWALVPALRHAFTLHPQINYVWSLTADALITNLTLSLHEHIFSPLSSLMLKDIPVVPPDSVIHTFSHLQPTTANLILTQDYDNLAHTSFILRNSLTIPLTSSSSSSYNHHSHQKDTWTSYFLDAWFDPLYRAYAFQKAENHALEHIIQWHPTLLAKLVLIDQRLLNSYNYQVPKSRTSFENDEADDDSGSNTGGKKSHRSRDSMWQPGDLIINFRGCERNTADSTTIQERKDEDSQGKRDCEREMRMYFNKWLASVAGVDGKPVDVKLKMTNQEYEDSISPNRGKTMAGDDQRPSDYKVETTQV